MDELELEVLLRRRLHARFDGARPSRDLREAVLRPPADAARTDPRRQAQRVRSNWILAAAVFAGIVVLGAVALTGRLDSLVGQASPAPPSATPAAGPSSSPTPFVSPSVMPAGAMTTTRAFQTATVLRDGRILITGGVDAPDTSGGSFGLPTGSAELYDPRTGSFNATGSMTTPRAGHIAVPLADGRVLIVGGDQTITGDAPYHRSAELYDPATGTFSRTGSLTTTRDGFSATLLQDGHVLIAGGYDPHLTVGQGSTYASTESYDPTNGTFSATGSMTTAREGHSATLLDDGRVLIVGGDDPESAHPTAEVYDPTTATSTRTGSMVADARAGYDLATRLADGRVLMAGDPGGINGQIRLPGSSTAPPEIYDPRTRAFMATGPMVTQRLGAVVVLLADGRVLVAGGRDEQQTGGQVSISATAELFDTRTGTFTQTGSMSVPRFGASASLLGDGRVLLAGGEQSIDADGLHPAASAELYDPSTGTFSVISP